MSEDLEQRKVDRSEEEEEEEEDSGVSDEDETESEEEEDEDDEFDDPEGYVDDIADEGMCVRSIYFILPANCPRGRLRVCKIVTSCSLLARSGRSHKHCTCVFTLFLVGGVTRRRKVHLDTLASC